MSKPYPIYRIIEVHGCYYTATNFRDFYNQISGQTTTTYYNYFSFYLPFITHCYQIHKESK